VVRPRMDVNAWISKDGLQVGPRMTADPNV
jgi:hypothetical protein